MFIYWSTEGLIYWICKHKGTKETRSNMKYIDFRYFRLYAKLSRNISMIKMIRKIKQIILEVSTVKSARIIIESR
jgi:type III secretory pathway component EscV